MARSPLKRAAEVKDLTVDFTQCIFKYFIKSVDFYVRDTRRDKTSLAIGPYFLVDRYLINAHPSHK